MNRNKTPSPAKSRRGNKSPSPAKGRRKQPDEARSLLSRNDGKSRKSKKEKPPPEPIDYKFLDGLRGFGALAVYFSHFLL